MQTTSIERGSPLDQERREGREGREGLLGVGVSVIGIEYKMRERVGRIAVSLSRSGWMGLGRFAWPLTTLAVLTYSAYTRLELHRATENLQATTRRRAAAAAAADDDNSGCRCGTRADAAAAAATHATTDTATAATWDDTPTNRKLYEALARTASPSREAMLALANDVMMCSNPKTCWWNGGNVLKTFLEGTRRLEVRNQLIVSLDDETHNFCLGFGGINSLRLEMPVPSAQQKTRGANMISTLKYGLIKQALLMGYSILVVDLDLVFLKNPFDHLHRDADIEVSTDGFTKAWAMGSLGSVREPKMGWGAGGLYVQHFTLNVGCAYMRPTSRTIQLLDRVQRRMSSQAGWDQQVFNEEAFLLSHGLYNGSGVAVRVMQYDQWINSKVFFYSERQRFFPGRPVQNEAELPVMVRARALPPWVGAARHGTHTRPFPSHRCISTITRTSTRGCYAYGRAMSTKSGTPATIYPSRAEYDSEILSVRHCVVLFTTIITENKVLFLCTTHYERAQAFSPARLEATWSAASTSPCTELYSSSTLGVPAEAWRSEPEALVPLVALSG